MYSTDNAWSAKLMSITDAGCPSAAARLISRPSPSKLILRPSLIEYSSTKLRVGRFDDASFSSAGISISTLKWPELATMAPSFITSKCSLVSTFLLPVTVQKTSPIFAASFMDITRKPSITASSAFVGSTSVMTTSAPAPRARRASQQKVGRANDAVNRRLPGAVTIVEKVLGIGVVHGNDRIAQHAFFGHRPQADHASGRLLRAAQHAIEHVLPLGMQDAYQVRSIIHRDVRPVIDRRQNVAVISVAVLSLDGEHRNPVIAHQAGRDIILRRKRIRRAQHHISAAIAQADRQIRGFRRYMQAARNTDAFQRLVLNKFLADDLQNLHGLVRPFNPLLAEIGEVQVLDVTIHLRRCGSHASPVALKEICRIYCLSPAKSSQKIKIHLSRHKLSC